MCLISQRFCFCRILNANGSFTGTNYSINMEFRFSHKINVKGGEKSTLKQMKNIKNMPNIFGDTNEDKD